MILTFFYGFFSTIRVDKIIIFFICSETIRKLYMKCFLLNGLLLGSLTIMHIIIMPILILIIPLSFIQLNWIINLLFQILWAFPLYIISLFIEYEWYSEIARQSLIIESSIANSRPISNNNTLENLAGTCYRLLLIAALMIEILFCDHVVILISPIMGKSLALINLCWLYSFMIFDYRWSFYYWTIDQQLLHFQTNAGFYAGFGIPMAILTTFLPYFVGVGLYALLFPIFIIMTNGVDLPQGDYYIPIFYFPQKLNQFLFWCMKVGCTSRKKNKVSK